MFVERIFTLAQMIGETLFLFLTFNILGISCFCCLLLTFFKINFFSKISLRDTIRVSNGLDPDHDQHSVSTDLGPNCLQRLSTDDKGCC